MKQNYFVKLASRTLFARLVATVFAGLLFFCNTLVQAQAIQDLQGVVSDNNGKPVADVEVRVRGTAQIAHTQSSGAFVIRAAKGDRLSITHPNYYDQEVLVKASKILNLQLSERLIQRPGSELSYKDTALNKVEIMPKTFLSRMPKFSVVML